MDERRISEMRNLGPACERDLNAVGIDCAQDVINLGVKETFLRMMKGRIQRGKKGSAYHAAYLYALYGAIHDVDWQEVPAEMKAEYKAFTARLRKNHH